MRACQLAAFNLYLKGRMRAEAEGADRFEMPEVGIVCADAKIADVEGVEDVFDEVVDGKLEVENALKHILDAFEEVHGLGSLLDVRGTLSDLFEDDIDQDSVQITLDEDPQGHHTLSRVLHSLREAIDEQRDEDSFLAQDLRSFVRLLDILALDFDVALMNPPYGSRNRMPESVQAYVEDHYRYPAEFYINFFEICDRIVKENGRIGMLVPRTFMFRHKFEEFRKDFIRNESGNFDFLAEFGVGILDNATVRTAGTVVRSGDSRKNRGEFIRLHDLEKESKELAFAEVLSDTNDKISRFFSVNFNEFAKVPGSTICYSTPKEVRDLHSTETKLDAERGGLEGESIGVAKQGVATANSDRFIRFHWEVNSFESFSPISKGGADAWIVPLITKVIEWGENGTRVKRYSNTVRTPNEELYGKEGLTWTFLKETGRRFGYYPPKGLFSHTAFIYIPDTNQNLWNIMAALNSDLYHALFLSITIERNWNAGEVGSIPWHSSISDIESLEEIAKSQYKVKIIEQLQNPVSPFYIAPAIVPDDAREGFFYNHPQIKEVENQINMDYGVTGKELSISEQAQSVKIDTLQRQEKLEEYFTDINSILYKNLNINEDVKNDIETEISLRTSEDPKNRESTDSESISEIPDNINEQVKHLVHHFAIEAVREESDGIIPLAGADDQPDMLDRIVDRFHDAYGEHAEDRLVEVDDILGSQAAGDEAYPNLRAFIEEDLFAYHVGTMENTPIVWKLSAERLLADSQGEGFACFVDYHQIDASLFDRLSNQYLEPRKSELRDRRAAANQRRNDASLSTTEQAAATETFEFCSNALEQIAELEETMGELERTTEREFDADDRELVDELAPKVRAFRTETAERIDTLEALREHHGEAWFQDTFSDGFWDKVDEWRDEWLDALAELEHACEQYAKPSGEPVEAHLADLFDYFNWRLKGSDHYSSTGILFMTYYFEREGGDLLDDAGEPHETLTEDERKLASLAMGLDDPSILDSDVDGVGLAEYKQLAEEIDDRCQTVYKQIPSDWSDRALSEVTTDGYRPNHKHGVAINITPLAEKNIVPEVVEDKVL